MPKSIDLKGRRFERLLVVCRIRIFGRKGVRWHCVCDCGNFKIATPAHLQKRHCQSCGCLKRERLHGYTNTPTYISWVCMKQRCHNENAAFYENYGGRGIRVCERWRNSFRAFLADMGERPQGTSIDRINNDGHYEPGNCRWATRIEQARNAGIRTY